ncbi:hypothetical protein NDU88_006466 [Pleurodeles waltl]|uniref:Uncharacterized protein n=1 Tax=Pleurodeles waltl TaxID=8319 RepID=A0AAV7RS42_PLEWA|nr:hypothetical protein NDU88_006466 [Pleurodeles waltl]
MVAPGAWGHENGVPVAEWGPEGSPSWPRGVPDFGIGAPKTAVGDLRRERRDRDSGTWKINPAVLTYKGEDPFTKCLRAQSGGHWRWFDKDQAPETNEGRHVK